MTVIGIEVTVQHKPPPTRNTQQQEHLKWKEKSQHYIYIVSKLNSNAIAAIFHAHFLTPIYNFTFGKNLNHLSTSCIFHFGATCTLVGTLLTSGPKLKRSSLTLLALSLATGAGWADVKLPTIYNPIIFSVIS